MDETFEVGYRKPPRHSRFKPGMSGNRKGRPKARKNFKTIMDEELSRRMEVKVDGKTKKVSRFEALVMLLVQRGLQGDTKAIDKIITLSRLYGVGGEAPIEIADLTQDEEELLAAYKKKWLEEDAASPGQKDQSLTTEGEPKHE
jgi:hypothetical protein